MKNCLAFLVLLSVLVPSAFSFTASAPTLVKSGNLDSLIVFDAFVKNSSSDTIVISMLRDSLKTPEGWNASFCVGEMCYPDFVDSVDISIAPNDSTKVTLDVTPKTKKGWGYYTLTFVNKDNSADYQTLSFGLTNEAVNNISALSIAKENGFTAYDSLSKDGAFHQKIVNISEDTVDIKVLKEAVVLPSDYSFSLCANSQCYPPFTDTLPNVKLAPNDTLVIDIDYTTGTSNGSIVEKFTIMDETNNQNSSDIYSVFIRAETGISFTPLKISGKSISITSTNRSIEISGLNKSENVALRLYSIDGTLLSKRSYQAATGRITENFADIASGRYILTVKSSSLNFATGISLTR